MRTIHLTNLTHPINLINLTRQTYNHASLEAP